MYEYIFTDKSGTQVIHQMTVEWAGYDQPTPGDQANAIRKSLERDTGKEVRAWASVGTGLEESAA